MTTASPSVYILLGVHTSGREQVLLDLINNGLQPESPVPVYSSATESDTALLHTLTAENAIDSGQWQIDPDGTLQMDPAPQDAETLFLIGDGIQTPVDFMEAVAGWIRTRPEADLTITTVVHSALCAQHPQTTEWYNACIHFSDVVLLNRREEVPTKWINSYIDRFAKQFYPCIFDWVKQGRIPNPAIVLESPSRRMSQAFEQQDLYANIEIEGEADPDDDGLQPEPYFERLMNGRRAQPVPDIRPFLDTPT